MLFLCDIHGGRFDLHYLYLRMRYIYRDYVEWNSGIKD